MNRIKNSSFDVVIQKAATRFANEIVAEMRNIIVGSIGGIPLVTFGTETAGKPNGAPRKARGGRLHRRSAQDIAKGLERVQDVLKASKTPLRAEDIRTQLGLQSKEMPRLLKQGLATGVLKSSGQKRATVYSLTPVKAPAKPAKKAAPAKKSTKKAPAKATRRAAKKTAEPAPAPEQAAEA